jgi:glutathione S-transferase
MLGFDFRQAQPRQRILWLLEELGLPYGIRPHKRDPKTQLAPPELKQVHSVGKSLVIEDGGRIMPPGIHYRAGAMHAV